MNGIDCQSAADGISLAIDVATRVVAGFYLFP